MKQKQLQEMFEYKDGNLIYRVRRGATGKIGNVAGSICKINGYRRIPIDKKFYRAHRLVWIYYNGEIPIGLDIDHINRVKTDNRIQNLRLATNAQNTQNVTKRKDCSSGYKGVYYRKDVEKWVARIGIDNKRIHLGFYETAELAGEAYKSAAEKLHKEFACWE